MNTRLSPPPLERNWTEQSGVNYANPDLTGAARMTPLGQHTLIIGSPQVPARETTPQETILQEAQRLTHGPRQADYSHPLDDYTRTAALASALLAHKLKEPITAAEMTLVMCCVKLSRQVHKAKRDNMTDLAGYAWCTQEIGEESERRKL